MLSLGLKDLKIIWNEKPLLNKADRATLGALGHLGGQTRTIAKNSIKTKPDGQHSASGSPPYGHNGKTRYKDWIFYYLDRARKEMVCGAILLPRKDNSTVPGVLEHGGTSSVPKKKNWWKGPKITISQAPRPHMWPALEKACDKLLPKLLANSITP